MSIFLEDRMFCELYRCEMSVQSCIKRQENAKEKQSNWGAGRIKPGALDINCQNCEQGKKIMKDYSKTNIEDLEGPKSKEEMEKMKVCTDPDCEFKGEPQPISNFRIHKQSQKPVKICNSCMNKKISEGHKKRVKYKPGSVHILPKGAEFVNINLELTICFNQHPEVYEDLLELAKQELRTPENQALY